MRQVLDAAVIEAEKVLALAGAYMLIGDTGKQSFREGTGQFKECYVRNEISDERKS